MCYRENFPSSSCFIAFAEIIQIPSKILRGEEDDFFKNPSRTWQFCGDTFHTGSPYFLCGGNSM